MADMAPLSDILNDDPASAVPVQNNFQTIESYINGGELLRADGTKVMTGDLDVDSNKVVNLATPTASTDAATKAYVDAASTDPTPVGIIQMWGGDYLGTPPSGYLICNGAAISRSTYSSLFGVLGTTYGVGDGSTTFNIPNLQGKFPIGENASYPSNSTGGGSKDAVVVSHTHTASTSSDSHSHVYTRRTGTSGSASGASVNSNIGSGNTATDSDSHSHSVTVNSEGVSGIGANMPPYIAVNFIIRDGL